MSEEIEYLDLDDLVAAAEVAVGRRPEVRDWGLLESALARARASVFGEDAYPGLNGKAAALLHSVVTNHALVDGNERLDAPPIARLPGRVHDGAMDDAEVARWFEGYLESFAALGRGEVEDVGRILAHYSVPLIVSTDDECVILSDEAQVKAVAKQQFEGLRADGYDRSVVLVAESTVLNKSCAVHHGEFARIRADGSEISRIESTYFIVDGPAGPRISVLVRHTPQ